MPQTRTNFTRCIAVVLAAAVASISVAVSVNAAESETGPAKTAKPNRDSDEIPPLNELGSWSRLLDDLPYGRNHGRPQVPWAKFGVVLLGWFLWGRAMRIALRECEDYDLEGRDKLAGLFFVGLAGLIAAILIPAWLVGSAIVLATCLLPFALFLRWRNGSVVETIPGLTLRCLIRRDSTFWTPSRRMEGPSPESPSRDRKKPMADNEPTPDVVLLGKSMTSRENDSRLGEHARASTGFRAALRLIETAVNRRATDLHIHPNDREISVRMRIDGELRGVDPLDTDTGLAAINVLKILSDMNIADKRRSQDGSFRADVQGRRLSFRVSSQGVQTGEKLSIRILDPAQHLATFWSLGLPEPEYNKLAIALQRSQGMILFAGATGAGKSTSAYAAIRMLDAKARNIVTVEDPIEYQMADVDQIEINVKAGQTFQSALRSLLRHDTDVVLIGEVRDEETAQIACQAATTGQLVISTLHANDTVTGLFRLNELDVEPYITASAVRAVVSQNLMRMLCPQCRVSHRPNEQLRESLGLSEADAATIFRSMDPSVNSCLTCNGRGFLGRIGVFEYLEVTPEIREMVRTKAEGSAIREKAIEQGMTPMWDNGLRLVKQGVVSIEELQRVVER